MRVIEATSIHGEKIKIDMDFEEGFASGSLVNILMPLRPDEWSVTLEEDDGTRVEINAEDLYWDLMNGELEEAFGGTY